MKSPTRTRTCPRPRRLTPEQRSRREAERKEQFAAIAGGMFAGMMEGLGEIHRDSPELLTVLAG